VMAHLACVPQDLSGGTIMPVEGVDLPLYAMEVCLYFQYRPSRNCIGWFIRLVA